MIGACMRKSSMIAARRISSQVAAPSGSSYSLIGMPVCRGLTHTTPRVYQSKYNDVRQRVHVSTASPCGLSLLSGHWSLHSKSMQHRGLCSTPAPSGQKDEQLSIAKQLVMPPNLLTLGRIAATPVLSWMVVQGQYTAAVFGCAAAAFTDYLDGWVARKFNMTTIIGSYLDPLADKIFITMLAIASGYTGILPPAAVALFVLRDAGLIIGSFTLRKKMLGDGKTLDVSQPLQVHPTNLSKINTFLQLLCISGGVLHAAFPVAPPELLLSLVGATCATTVGSGYQYIVGYGTYFKFAESQDSTPGQDVNKEK